MGGILYSLRGEELGVKHYSARGDVIAQTNGEGSLTYQASYEGFGRHDGGWNILQTQQWGQTADRQRANTKDEDPTGLLNEGFRYRDLDTGAFLTRDPLGFVDGPNVYTYVVQNPWTKFDPEGLYEDIADRIKANRNQLYSIAPEARPSKERSAGAKQLADTMATGADLVASLTPVGSGIEAYTGQTATGESLSAGERVLSGIGAVPVLGMAIKEGKMLAKGVINAVDHGADMLKGSNAVSDGLKATDGVNSFNVAAKESASIDLNAMERGRQSEKYMLDKTGNTKNTKIYDTPDGKTIPDYVNSKEIGEIKDTISVSNTKQMRAQQALAEREGKEHILHTGQNTRVSKPLQSSDTRIERHENLGPKK